MVPGVSSNSTYYGDGPVDPWDEWDADWSYWYDGDDWWDTYESPRGDNEWDPWGEDEYEDDDENDDEGDAAVASTTAAATAATTAAASAEEEETDWVMGADGYWWYHDKATNEWWYKDANGDIVKHP